MADTLLSRADGADEKAGTYLVKPPIISAGYIQCRIWDRRPKKCWVFLAAATTIVLATFVTVWRCAGGTSSVWHTHPHLDETVLKGRSVADANDGSLLVSSTERRSAASAGCSAANSVTVNTILNITLGDRRYLLYFPVNYQPDEPAPVVLSYHGGTRTAESQLALDLLTTTYFNTEYIVVYPNGINATWQGVPQVTTDDVGFTSDILDELEEKYCIDKNRIFATGKSQGGGFVGVLACDEDLSQRVAAFAPVSGAFYVSDFGDVCQPVDLTIQPCDPGRDDIPILDFHGLADGTIAYYGGTRRGACLPTIPHWVQNWAELDGLGLTNTSSRVPGALSGSSAVRYEFGTGSNKGLVTHIMDGTDIGHVWPSTQPNSDNETYPASFNASSLILDFFANHPLS